MVLFLFSFSFHIIFYIYFYFLPCLFFLSVLRSSLGLLGCFWFGLGGGGWGGGGVAPLFGVGGGCFFAVFFAASTFACNLANTFPIQ